MLSCGLVGEVLRVLWRINSKETVAGSATVPLLVCTRVAGCKVQLVICASEQGVPLPVTVTLCCCNKARVKNCTYVQQQMMVQQLVRAKIGLWMELEMLPFCPVVGDYVTVDLQTGSNFLHLSLGNQLPKACTDGALYVPQNSNCAADHVLLRTDVGCCKGLFFRLVVSAGAVVDALDLGPEVVDLDDELSDCLLQCFLRQKYRSV